MRLQYFCIQYWDNEVFPLAKFFKIMNFACISVWFGLDIVSVKKFRLECFCFLLSCISKLIYPCWPFLDCINYFSFELVDVFRIFQFVLVLVG